MNQHWYDRLKPAQAEPCSLADVEIEQQIFGAIFTNNDALEVVSQILKPEYFSEQWHQVFFETCCEIAATGKKVTPLNVGACFPNKTIGDFTVREYLIRCLVDCAGVVIAKSYAEGVADLYWRRKIVEAASSAIEDAKALSGREDYSAGLDRLDASLLKIREGANGSNLAVKSIGEAAAIVEENIRKRRSNEDDTSFIETGLHQINRRINGGWRRKRLYVGSGRPGMGKTVFGVSAAYKAARRGAGVGMFSLEIDDEEIGARTISAHYQGEERLNYSAILGGSLDEEQHGLVVNAVRSMADLPIEIDCTPGLSIPQIEARARLMRTRLERRGFTLDLLEIDYLGLLRAAGKAYSRVNELSEIVLGAKNMAKTLDCAVILFAQLNRGVESREDKRPIMTDLRDSGSIEEHADAVFLLYRPAYYDERTQRLIDNGAIQAPPNFAQESFSRRHDLELIWDKNRLGPPGTDVLHCRPGASFVTHGRADANG